MAPRLLHIGLEQHRSHFQVRPQPDKSINTSAGQSLEESLPTLRLETFNRLLVGAVDWGCVRGGLPTRSNHELKLALFVDGHLGGESGEFFRAGFLALEYILVFFDGQLQTGDDGLQGSQHHIGGHVED